jgi:hypothetical protein
MIRQPSLVSIYPIASPLPLFYIHSAQAMASTMLTSEQEMQALGETRGSKFVQNNIIEVRVITENRRAREHALVESQ